MYTKAHFRFVKALLTLRKIRDARHALSMAFKECGEQIKEFKDLEQEIFTISGIPLRPKSTDFEVMSELGDGNFSKVYKTFLKSTKQNFAIKAIERAVIEKMKRRHPNIHNEILMGKRVLHKLDHPGIVPL
jgi:serine/threonine protein kinase